MKRLILVFGLTAGFAFVAQSAHAQQPGQLLSGFPPNPAVTLAEHPEAPAGTIEPTVVVPLQSPVQSGYLVLFEPLTADPHSPQNWSDVVVFEAASHGPLCMSGDPATLAILVSDSPGEFGITNADLAQAGTSVAQILACGAFTVYQAESTRADGFNLYTPSPNSVYNIFSDPATGPVPTRRNTWGRVKAIYR